MYFWYRLNGMGAQENVPKKVLVTLFPYLFHVKTKWSSLQILKTEIFSIDTNILPQMHWALNIFGPSATTIGVFGVSLTYPILNFKKSLCPKNVWMQHCKRRITHNLFIKVWCAIMVVCKSFVCTFLIYFFKNFAHYTRTKLDDKENAFKQVLHSFCDMQFSSVNKPTNTFSHEKLVFLLKVLVTVSRLFYCYFHTRLIFTDFL